MNARFLSRPAVTGVVAVACIALMGAGNGNGKGNGNPHDAAPLTVPKAQCGPNDHPETALQGQVPATLRAAGFKGFNCNLELIGQSKGEGANWQTTEFTDKTGRRCAYHGTASPARSLPGRQNFGVPVIDISNPTNPTPTAYLTTTSMLDPWESLKVNERRQLLGADNGQNGGGGPEVDIYDLSSDCSNPQLLASLPVGTGTDGSGIVQPIIGHEGAWAPDGLTYYGGDLRFTPPGATARTGQYYAVDTADPTHPKLITTWTTGVPLSNVHGMSISNDGTRGYFVSIGGLNAGTPADVLAAPPNDGLLIYDLTDIQERKPNAQAKLISTLLWKDGALYAGGLFTNSGSQMIRNLARWDGTSWAKVGGDLDGSVTARYSDTRQGGSPHTDGVHHPGRVPDFVTLYCLRQAPRGGALVLVHIDDVLERLRHRPDVLETLRLPVHFDTRDDGTRGVPRTVQRPVLVVEGGRIVEDGVPSSLAACPETRYRALLDAEATAHEELWSSGIWRRLRLVEGRIREEGRSRATRGAPRRRTGGS